MDDFITYNRELIKVIDGIPVPDITVSSLSQQSARQTHQTRNKDSQTKEQVLKILKRAQISDLTNQQQRGNLYLNTISTFEQKVNQNQDKNVKNNSQKKLLHQNCELQIQTDHQKRVIEQQITQIAHLNNQIEHLSNEILENNIKIQMLNQTVQQLQILNSQQQQIIQNIQNEKINQKKIHKESGSITELKSKIQNLESEFNKTKATFSLFSPKNDTFQSDTTCNQKNKTFDPELLSEDETLQMFITLLNRVSKSQRMISVLQKNADFKQLIKIRRQQSSMNKLSCIQQSKSLDRKQSYNQENFYKIVKNLGIKIN